ncbi:FAD:protein FMN transferase [Pseudooceanicola algae]|uniref:FAD:protein FMN transferase n=2 Tax=Pseudooceanicola algae TaxID=1537215 RepID=A0A418SJC9_9RHOB|nr:FAD:protein FMN transferase [Pseudooceanicola algae]
MGTQWSLQCWTCPGLPDPAPLINRAWDEAIALFSPWSRDSALSRFNHAAPGWHVLPPEITGLLDLARDIAARTGGALDPTLGRLTDLWGFGPSGPVTTPPTPDALERARAASGLQKLHAPKGGDANQLYQPGGLWLDFGGIAKGWAVDRASALLHTAGLTTHMIELGGEIAAKGLSPEGAPWWIEVEAAPGAPSARWLGALHRGAVAGSGTWRRRSGAPGQDWSHSLNPATGRPCDGAVVGVHVFHPSAASADAWASALMVLPPETGLTIAADNDLSVLLTLRGPGGQVIRQASPALMEWEAA